MSWRHDKLREQAERREFLRKMAEAKPLSAPDKPYVPPTPRQAAEKRRKAEQRVENPW